MSGDVAKTGSKGRAGAAPVRRRPTRYKEFMLVVILLAALVISIVVVVRMPADYLTGTFDSDPKQIIEFKKEILALLLPAFSAWIGAGAAYFFGRENFREAVRSMNKAHGVSEDDEDEEKTGNTDGG